jgi:hypothetical protein
MFDYSVLRLCNATLFVVSVATSLPDAQLYLIDRLFSVCELAKHDNHLRYHNGNTI